MEAVETRLANRYLRLLRDALLDEHYLENEFRIAHLVAAAAAGQDHDPNILSDPGRYSEMDLDELRRRRDKGLEAPGGAGQEINPSLAYTQIGRYRLDHLKRCFETILEEGVGGDLIDCGTQRGGAAIFLRGLIDVNEDADPAERTVWVVDRFDGRATPDGLPGVRPPSHLAAVRQAFDRFELLDERVVFLQGQPAETLPSERIESIALLRIGSEDPAEIKAALGAAYEKVSPGGYVVVDAYEASGCSEAVDRFRSERGEAVALERIDSRAACWRKPSDSPVSSAGAGAEQALVHSTKRDGQIDLSVVVVAYNMARESKRTLHSLSRAYQEGVEDLDYEVIVVENGSLPEQRLGEEFVSSFGPEFRYVDLAEEADPSPTVAINRGVASSRGRVVAMMIDGAHMLTPGVLRLGILALSTYQPAIATARQWYLGPGQQPHTVAYGYDQEAEDVLLERIQWPLDGYKLFDIGHFVGARDWFDGEIESNCIFAERALLDQIGAMDESFAVPGGGFANLDLFERLLRSPGVNLVTLLGEGSFHQVHGGTTTNREEAEEREELLVTYADQYEELRGDRLYFPPQEPSYVGSLPLAARRTRRRAMSAPELRFVYADPADRRPSRPIPVADELKRAFTDAFWRSGDWHTNTWLGWPTHRPATDLAAYQQILFDSRPKWIIDTRAGTGGRALFLASVCELIGEGRIVAIDNYLPGERAEHERITYVAGDPLAAETIAKVHEIVGDEGAMLILGASAGFHMIETFRSYKSLVPIGAYAIVEDTILDSEAVVWPAFGSGPAGVVGRITTDEGFIRDPAAEPRSLTFNPGGYLKRVR